MKGLTNPVLIKAKGIVFFIVACLSAGLLVLENPTWKAGLLIAITVWCFCRSYYFAFYVIEHYVDPDFRFSGLWSFACYLLRNRRNPRQPGANRSPLAGQ